MSIELLLNAVNLNLMAFSNHSIRKQGQVLPLDYRQPKRQWLAITIYRNRDTVDMEHFLLVVSE